MRIPIIQGTIDRRILINYRVEPDALAKVLPTPFEPKVINGFGIAGICLIRLEDIRPRWIPAGLGMKSENAAHRIAIRWQQNREWREGVYIPRRDTDSWLNTMVGGRIFPGIHHHARFEVDEVDEYYGVALKSLDDHTTMKVEAKLTDELPEDSIFDSLESVSDFFEAGALGYSPAFNDGDYDALELRAFNWDVQPMSVEEVRSSFFEEERLFPMGTVTFDNALLMKGIQHEWHEHEPLYT